MITYDHDQKQRKANGSETLVPYCYTQLLGVTDIWFDTYDKISLCGLDFAALDWAEPVSASFTSTWETSFTR